MTPKIIAFDTPSSEGVNVIFEKKFSLNGGISTNVWWLSWEKFKEFFNSQLTVCIHEIETKFHIGEVLSFEFELNHFVGRVETIRVNDIGVWYEFKEHKERVVHQDRITGSYLRKSDAGPEPDAKDK